MEDHISRALDLASAFPEHSPSRVLDLGSGAGLPGLPLALAWPESRWVLLDGSTTRAAFLAEAVEALGLGDRVSVWAERAETAGRRTEARGAFDAVVARSFGPPAVTAECASPFLRPGGTLVVAEPPGGDPDRWLRVVLATLGLRLISIASFPTSYAVLEQVAPCPDRFPRRVGVPGRRPLA